VNINNNFNRYWNGRPGRPFHGGWWGGRYPGWCPWGRPGFGRWHWWAPCTVGAIGSFFVGAAWGSAWSQPLYYSYGDTGGVYYENNVVYVDGAEYATGEEYYQEAQTISTNVPEYTDDQGQDMDWLPLGVWVVTQEDVAESDRLIQLAVNKEGVIAGNYWNENSEVSVPLAGSVDKETQRAAWSPTDEKNREIVMETGIYNLTEETTQALLHYGPDRTEQVLLVRLEQPSDDAPAGQK
jgi:hypothetical protein